MNADLDPVNEDDDCGCDWPAGCAGLGVLYCGGCGGDQCICICGGESDCFGCEECREPGDDDDLYDPMEMGDAGPLVPRVPPLSPRQPLNVRPMPPRRGGSR